MFLKGGWIGFRIKIKQSGRTCLPQSSGEFLDSRSDAIEQKLNPVKNPPVKSSWQHQICTYNSYLMAVTVVGWAKIWLKQLLMCLETYSGSYMVLYSTSSFLDIFSVFECHALTFQGGKLMLESLVKIFKLISEVLCYVYDYRIIFSFLSLNYISFWKPCLFFLGKWH